MTMFTWNHRVIRDEDGTLLFGEVCYNEDGTPFGYNAPFMCGDDIEELRWLLNRLNSALDHPLIEERDFTHRPTTEEC